MANTDGYAAIQGASAALGLPKQYISDLEVVDKGMLYAENAPADFAWCVREQGTEVFAPNDPCARTLGLYAATTDHNYDSRHFFIYAAGALRQTDREGFTAWITEHCPVPTDAEMRAVWPEGWLPRGG